MALSLWAVGIMPVQFGFQVIGMIICKSLMI